MEHDEAIYISIKPKFTAKIETGEKTYEFRKYIPKKDFKFLYVYETLPIKELKYIIEISDIATYPDKIDNEGYGNKEFNNGEKISKYAYKISKVYKLDKPISLDVLRSEFGFVPPQGYSYDTKFEKLTQYLKDCSKTLICEN